MPQYRVQVYTELVLEAADEDDASEMAEALMWEIDGMDEVTPRGSELEDDDVDA